MCVKILRYVVGHDCGRLINPMLVDGQVRGGVVHGIGNALFERMIHDENGQPVTTNYADYLLPTAPEVPRIEIIHFESPSPLNPIGVKGGRRRRYDSRRGLHHCGGRRRLAAIRNPHHGTSSIARAHP